MQLSFSEAANSYTFGAQTKINGMKKSTLLLSFILISFMVSAQSQRLQIVEEFTGETCVPCAIKNPAFNSLLKKNTSKIVAIKYQAPIPSPTPTVLYQQTFQYESERRKYYKDVYAPWCFHDGNKLNSAISPPGDDVWALTQAKIDAEALVPSPFDISLTHSVSDIGDSIYITMIITASMDVSTTDTFVAHLVLCEEEIHFDYPPGSNGEKDFYMPMRAMYPNAKGTVLPQSWTVGQSDTVKISGHLPYYIYQTSEIAVVGFVQDNKDKNIKQGAISTPKPVNVDLYVSSVNLPELVCGDKYTPAFTLVNKGEVTLDSCEVSYKVDNGSPVMKKWTGSLDKDKSTTVLLDELNLTQGKHTIAVTCSMPNGVADFTGNNTASSFINVVRSYSPPPVYESFAGSFPPANWFVYDNDRDNTTWKIISGYGGFGYSNRCVRLQFYAAAPGTTDDLILPPLDLSGETKQFVTFNVAYAPYLYNSGAVSADELSLRVSTDCGAHWYSVWVKDGMSLATANPTGSEFFPTANQWRAESVDISKYCGRGEVLLKFHSVSDNGNTVFLDDINVSTSSVGIEDAERGISAVVLSPNPANTFTNLSFYLTYNADINLTVTNVLGEVVYAEQKGQTASGNQNFKITTETLPAGIYLVNVNAGKEILTKKIIVVK